MNWSLRSKAQFPAALLMSLLGLAWTIPAAAAGKLFEVEYPAATEPGKLIYGVTYTVWIPDGVKKLRGVIVHQHGCGSGACKGGKTAAYDLHWQALAKKWDCALLGPYYHQEDGQDCRKWCDPRNGSEQTFLQCLTDLAEKSQHPELKDVPWCLWGHSGGGFWASIMQTMHPDRIVGIWFRSGTAYATWEKGEIPKPEIPAAAYGIPMVLNPGAKEKDDKRFSGAWTGSEAMFNAYRTHGAPATFAPDPKSAHECGDCRYMAIPFFDACLASRLPDKDSSNQKLRALEKFDDRHPWLPLLWENGATVMKPPLSTRTSPEWLARVRASQALSQYVATGVVPDGSPPPAPFNVKVTLNADQQIEITWDAEADFESGIQAFIIQRNGQPLAQVPEKPIGRFGKPLFQTMSYHDTPEAPLPQMRFVDKTAKAGEKAVYQVITVNTAGLKSEPATANP